MLQHVFFECFAGESIVAIVVVFLVFDLLHPNVAVVLLF
jgi:hypothetical protein